MIGSLIDDRYKIIDKIGSGGMGSVYLGEDFKEKKSVAIKVISTVSVDKSLIKRFYSEAEILRVLSHKHIVKLYDFIEKEKKLFIIMEYVEGTNIKEKVFLEKDRISALVEYIIQLCDGLEFAHSTGIIHRDIKPSNIRVTKEGIIKILDFGIARNLSSDSSITKTGEIIGTLSYLAPEQVLGKKAGPLSDLYSLGILCYEIITGRLPFVYADKARLLFSIVSEEPLPPSYFNSSVPLELDRIILKLLSKDPRDRYSSLKLLKEHLIDTDFFRYTGKGKFLSIRSPLVGRDDFLDFFRRKLSVLSSESSLVVLCGEKGTGKTRLIRELKTLSYMEDVYYLSGSCNSPAGPYDPFKEIIKRFWAFENDKKLKRELMKFPWIRKLADIYFDLIDTGNRAEKKSYEEERRKFFSAIEEFFSYLSEKNPLLVIFEDVHLATGYNFDLLNYIIPGLLKKKVMIVLTVNEQELKEEKIWKSFNSHSDIKKEILKLAPLEKREIYIMLTYLFKSHKISDEILDYLAEKTSGNPFFIEEFCRFLLEEKLVFEENGCWKLKENIGLKLPDSAGELMRGRLNNITDTEKKLLFYASVLGKRFDIDILSDLYDGSEDELWNGLDLLVAREILREQWSVAGDYYVFSNPLFCDVIYDMISGKEKKELHRKAAELILLSSSEVSCSEIGKHYIKAGEIEKGVEFIKNAALEYMKISANYEALVYLKKAYELIEKNEKKMSLLGFEVSFLLASLFKYTGDFKKSLFFYKRALDFSSPENRCEIYFEMGKVFYEMGDLNKSLDFYDKALLEKGSNREVEMMLFKAKGLSYMEKKDYENSLKYLNMAISIEVEDSFFREKARIFIHLASVYRQKQDIKKALAYLKEVEPLAENNIHGEVFLERGNISKEEKNKEASLKYYMKALDAFSIEKNTGGSFRAYIEIGDLYRTLFMDCVKALEYYEEALNILQNRDFFRYANSLYFKIAFSYHYKGDRLKARNYYEKALKSLSGREEDRLFISLSIHYGRFLLEEGELKRASGFIEKGYFYSKKNNLKKEELFALNVLCELHLKLKNYEKVSFYLDCFEPLKEYSLYELAVNSKIKAEFYNEIGREEMALFFCKEGKAIALKEAFLILLSKINIIEAHIYYKKKEYEKALFLLDDSETIFRDLNYLPGLSKTLYRKGNLLVEFYKSSEESFKEGVRLLDEAKKYFILLGIFDDTNYKNKW